MKTPRFFWVFVFLIACLGCSGIEAPFVFDGPIPFQPNYFEGRIFSIEIQVLDEQGEIRETTVDTGSPYYLLGSADNSQDIGCTDPEFFSFGVGEANFCPELSWIQIIDANGLVQILTPRLLRMGRSYFVNWGPTPYALLGLSGNLVGSNRPLMQPVISQLEPNFLSFSFPNGLSNPGIMRFAPLESQSKTLRIPLTPPGSLGYGYTAAIQRLEFIIGQEVVAKVTSTGEGVFIEQGNAATRVADDFLAFFDTGTPMPLYWGNGDISLLSDDVSTGDIIPNEASPLYDRFRVVFLGEDGGEIILDSGDLGIWKQKNHQAHLLTPEVTPTGMSMLSPILGINFLANYDFQFEYSSGWATHITFFER